MRPATPLVTIVIPTRDRQALVGQAVQSALDQTVAEVEVVVVDDASDPPVRLASDPRVRLVRLDVPGGNGAARNAGLAVARGRWLTSLDDDDVMLPHLVAVSLSAIERSELPPPVAALSGVAVVSASGAILERRLPPSLPRGSHFSLEPTQQGRSFNSKQTLVAEVEVLRGIGGWDPAFRSRTVTELFLRLNPVCSIQGVDEITYHLRAHDGPRLSTDPSLRQASFVQLVAKHGPLFEAHPQRYAGLLVDHALMSLHVRQRAAAADAIGVALRRSPATVVRRAPQLLRALR